MDATVWSKDTGLQNGVSRSPCDLVTRTHNATPRPELD
ncbi:hypothetical protein RvY_01923 [Ramazzottius varieornatus]|uniref:Uncharacterized protein n=1 Tax=Ramazzottius varieornatus TaxID=947166 RepID=A0A1D1UI41_RAMVA|nr:hypothetical protein RvY_01923 [Ramazzottius varieornatus]